MTIHRVNSMQMKRPAYRAACPLITIAGLCMLSLELLLPTASAQSVFPAQQPMLHSSTRAPIHADKHFRKGWQYGEQGKFEKAILELTEAVKFNPNHIEAHFYLAGAYAETNQHDMAMASYRHLLSISPNDLDAHFDLGRLYLLQGQTDLARQEALTLDRLDPTMGRTLHRLITQAPATK